MTPMITAMAKIQGPIKKKLTIPFSTNLGRLEKKSRCSSFSRHPNKISPIGKPQ